MQIFPAILARDDFVPVADAEWRLAQARLRLERLRWAALFGADGAYDPDEYDLAILAYRYARSAADAARAARLARVPYAS